MAAVRVDGVVVEPLLVESDESLGGTALLAPFGSSERWQQLQRLRRGQQAAEPLIAALSSGSLAPRSDLLAALWGQLDRAGVERLLGSIAADNAAPWLEASRLELPALASQPAVERAWLEPLLTLQQEAAPDQQLAWLEVLAQFLDPRVAQRLRRVVLETSRTIGATLDQPPDAAIALEAVLPLLPLLGRQRQRQDGVLLLQCSLEPGPLAWRRAALEGVALGLSSWPLPLLAPALGRLAGDLSPALANQAIDLLARLPDGQRQLRRLVSTSLEASAAERLRRRRVCTPLVLVVHGRQGGEIPAVYDHLAHALQERRRAPVLIQALTGTAPPFDQRLKQRAGVAGGITLVPLLLLPGEHVRRDVPAIAGSWSNLLATEMEATATLHRLPFLGAWPTWQRLLAQELQQRGQGRRWLWLHHPLQGHLADRYLAHLGRILGQPGCAADTAEAAINAPAGEEQPLLLAPLSLAPNRFSESLRMERSPASATVLAPLLELPAVREFLLSQLEALP